jgi:hypothetical protein
VELSRNKATTDSKPKSGMDDDNPAVRLDHEEKRKRSGCTQEGSYRLV